MREKLSRTSFLGSFVVGRTVDWFKGMRNDVVPKNVTAGKKIQSPLQDIHS